ncbi:MAG: beta-lactamase domain protein [Conexibacter sp.]|nr:beta-lactamase domain protein [Conexibacter sp.]
MHGARRPLPLVLPLPFPVGTANAWLLPGDPLTLIDTGLGWPPAARALDEALGDHGVRVADLELVVLTHHHVDHVGLASEIQARSGCRIAAHAATAARLADVVATRALDDAWQVAMLHLHGAGEAETGEVGAAAADAASWQVSLTVDDVLADGDIVRAGGHSLEVTLRPGHCSTDTLFVAADDGWAMLGDHLLAFAPSPVIIDPGGAPPDPRRRPRSLATYRAGLARTAASGLRTGFTGHGPVVDDPAALARVRLADQDRRAQRLLEIMPKGGATAWALAQASRRPRDATGERHPMSFAYLMLCEALGLLDLLADRGEVRERAECEVVLFERCA